MKIRSTRGLLAPVALLTSAILLSTTACTSTAPRGEGTEEDGWAPQRSTTMIVPSNAGGGSDLLGRAVAAGIESVRNGVVVSVENHPGGSNAVGYAYLLQHDGDPHFLISAETAAISLPLSGAVDFDVDDFTPIAQVAEDAVLFVVRGDSPYDSLTDLVAAAESKTLNLAVGGVGSPDDIVAELFQDATTEFNKVVFQGGAELLLALLSGDVAVGALNPGEVAGQIASGDLKAIAVFSEDHLTGDLADIPTALEQGIDVTFSQFRGIFAAGNLDEAEIAYWQDTIVEWTETESYQDYIDGNTLVPTVRVGKDFIAYLAEYRTQLEQGAN